MKGDVRNVSGAVGINESWVARKTMIPLSVGRKKVDNHSANPFAMRELDRTCFFVSYPDSLP